MDDWAGSRRTNTWPTGVKTRPWAWRAELGELVGHPGRASVPGEWPLDPDLRGGLEGLRGCCRKNQLATRTRHPPDDPESEDQPGSPLAWSPTVSMSWWWSCPPCRLPAIKLWDGAPTAPLGGCQGAPGNASLFLWVEVLEAPLTAAAQAFAPSVLPRHPGSRKGLSPWTLMSGVSQSVALRLKAVSADGSLHLAGTQSSSPIPQICPASLLPYLLTVISTSFSELRSTLRQNRPEPCCLEWETFFPSSRRPGLVLEAEQMPLLGRGVRC